MHTIVAKRMSSVGMLGMSLGAVHTDGIVSYSCGGIILYGTAQVVLNTSVAHPATTQYVPSKLH